MVPMTEIVSIQKHASKVYTRNVFRIVSKHMRRQGLYYKVDAVHGEGTIKYFLEKYNRLELTWTVDVNKSSRLMECSCLKLESKGFPYYHIFHYVVLEHMKNIPKSTYIQKVDQKACEATRNPKVGNNIFDSMSEMARYGIRAGGKPIPWDTNIGSRMDYITEMLGLTPNLGLGGFVMLIELAKRFERMIQKVWADLVYMGGYKCYKLFL
ncbi:hypothetical protein M9H77_20984 [Catharanthus roseus]|uniref:Uncharacterized protein n=1 Tax=Catharanthus roseus TaxID=4058 RepID=A0ACC0ALR0_CATRO|nr:hypothetical protein M9H77_20984 [Catharanthus roseus]